MQGPSYHTEQEILTRLKAGDKAAFTHVYDIYWPLLYHHACKMLRDDDEAMDVVQEIFLILWNNASELNITGSIRSYLYSAVRNLTINHINRSKLKDKYLQSLADMMEKGESVTDEQVIYNDFVIHLEKEIANLPPKMREVFELSRKEGLSHKQIAEELAITDHTVKKTINRALKVLRARISSFIFSWVL